ncbi:GT2 family glycosyltransferase [Isoptericola jiangsuensis]|uniref:GT2 family glycosyltransferase n=1 Tax=Isoptericola jiangsuensis TaxID=548579 RepID=A0A2A9F0B0_9MICO|nr:GT2 family glycosyltransferase [Isoptericola jiangsuensis]
MIIASTRRPGLLGRTVEALLEQTVPADLVVLSVAGTEDVPAGLAARDGVRVVVSERGSTVQRNTGLRSIDPVPDLVTYLDDDILLAPDYFERLRDVMRREPDVVLLTGLVVVDGAALGRELSPEEARAAISAAPESSLLKDIGGTYGCNMTTRGHVALREPFDERMRLYAWQEDTDFAVRCHAHGRVVHYWGCVAAHLAVGSGRVNGRALGFAQIVNPFHMWRKGTKSAGNMVHDWWRYLGSNTLRLGDRSRPDRSGRLVGNLLGFREVAFRGGRPEAVEKVAASR